MSRRHTTERGQDPACATGAVERGATLPLVEERYEAELARSAAVLDGVDRALDRLSEGTYGTCEVCGAAITDVELEGDPTRRLCGEHLALGEL